MQNPVSIKSRRLSSIQWALLLGCLLVIVEVAQKATAEGAGHTVVIEGVQFSPTNLKIKAGDTVIWKNKDPFPHTATSNDKAWDSEAIESSQTWKFKAKKKGIYPYICTFHSTMKAVLVVE